jgi:Tol biopolymer transport system component
VTHYRVGQTWSASWFPDGRRIAYSHEDTLTILDLENGRARHFATPLRGHLVRTPAVSPDGSRVVFQVFRAGAWMLNVEDGSMECVLSDPTAEEFAWAPDGHRFAFHSRRDGQWSVYMLSGLGSAH